MFGLADKSMVDYVIASGECVLDSTVFIEGPDLLDISYIREV